MYGKIKDWKRYDHLGYACDGCGSIKVKWTDNDIALCNDCYTKHVIIPNTEPIEELEKLHHLKQSSEEHPK